MKTLSLNDCPDCFAIAGETMIDLINPFNGLSVHFNHALEQIRERYPKAEKMTVAAFMASKAAAQNTPVEWQPITEEHYWEMLEVLPPALMLAGAFLVGEAMDHCAATGRPRYSAFLCENGQHYAASRPVTKAEMLKIIVQRGWSRGQSIAAMETLYRLKITVEGGLAELQANIAAGKMTIERA